MHTEVDVPNPIGCCCRESTRKRRWHWKKDEILAVPQEAVNIEGDKEASGVVDRSNRVENRKVTTGIETPNDVEVVSGLEEGDQVAVGDRSSLKAGEVVTPKEITLIQGPTEPEQ